MKKSMFAGYPHDGKVKSAETFPNRIPTRIVEGKVMAHINDNFYPDWKDCGEDHDKVDFLLDRIHDYNTALDIAEQQILDIAAEYPFLPQDFGFLETDDKFAGEGFQPQCYRKGRYLIARIDDDHWFVAGIGKIMMPSSQVAYIVLRSLGIITDEEFSEDEVHRVSMDTNDIAAADETIKKEMEIYKEGFHNGQKAVIMPVDMSEVEKKEAEDGK